MDQSAGGSHRHSPLDVKAERDDRLRTKLERELGAQILGALADPKVVEVMVNGDGRVWTDRLGDGMSLLDEVFSPSRAANLVGTVASLLHGVANTRQPIVEGELPFHNFRFEGLVPPVVEHSSFAIRKHTSSVLTFDDHYIPGGQLGVGHAELLRKAVDEKHNIIVTGGTGSGKTTFVNALLREKVDRGETSQRFIVLEDTRELQCDAANTVAMRTGEGASLTQLVRATMRMRPDAIIVGEVRGREALDMLKAWNTGHPGGICTVHANSARAALSRIDQLVQENDVPSQPLLIGEAVDLIVGIRQRSVREVIRVHRFDPERRDYDLEELVPPTQ